MSGNRRLAARIDEIRLTAFADGGDRFAIACSKIDQEGGGGLRLVLARAQAGPARVPPSGLAAQL